MTLIGRTATRVAADNWEAVIGFEDTTVLCSLRDEVAASQNPHDEVIHVSVDILPAGGRAAENTLAELPGRRLTGILVVDTIVYFTDHVTYGKTYKISQGARSLFSRIRAALFRTDTHRLRAALGQVLTSATGGHDELTALPSSDGWRAVDQRFLNHVEAGLVFQFDQLCLPAFTPDNRFAMVCSRERPLQPIDEVMREFGRSCRFMELSMTPLNPNRDVPSNKAQL